MQIKIKDKNGINLKTNKRYCEEDISVTVETEELNIIPGITEQINEGLFDKVTVGGDSNLVPENIKNGITIFGIEGNFETLDTSDATATADDISEGKTAYVNNEKITGTSTKIDTDDADATASDIALGKTAYVKGEKIIGSLEVGEENTYLNTTGINTTAFSLAPSIIKINSNALVTSRFSSFSNAFNNCYNLLEIPNIDTSRATRMDNMFYSCEKITKIPNINTDKVTTMQSMFCNCANLLEIPVLNTANVTNMNNMFQNCKKIKEIQNIDMNNVQNAQYMFFSCNDLEIIETLNTSKLSSIYNMFNGCNNLKIGLDLDLIKCTNASYAFYGCGKNTNNQITLSNTNKVTNWSYAFAGFCSKNVSMLDTSAAIQVEDMFANWQGETLPINSIGKATSIYAMCFNATGLVTFPEIDTSKVTRFQQFVRGYSNLVNVPVLDMTSANNSNYVQYMFTDCPSLSDESLNNILASLATAVKITNANIKNLNFIGLSQEQAEKCTTLSNWQALSDLGWRTGF